MEARAHIAEVVDLQLEYGLGVEAMMPLRPSGEDWVGVEPVSYTHLTLPTKASV